MPAMFLESRTAIITGAAAARGIGLATARLFAEHGARIALVDIDGDGVRAAARSLGSQHRAYPCDVTDAARCAQIVGEARDEFGSVDILINNAGVVFSTPIMDIDAQEYDTVMDVNLRGNFNMARAVIPHMRKQGRGAIVCMSSIAGRVGGGVFGTTHYAAAKSAIFGLAKGLARELAADGIRTNAIAPGPIDNDFTHGKMTEEIKAGLAAKVPLGRLGRPQDIANACLFLSSDLSSYITGVVLDVNGGLLIH
jgi:NAD(P)-dependent dehydrogenase (short-subunit alcohol dehydrogenase family)